MSIISDIIIFKYFELSQNIVIIIIVMVVFIVTYLVYIF